MFSNISNIFRDKPVQRQAEQSDTRQAIQRHEPDHERRRRKREQDKDENAEDRGSMISVQALLLFLDNFLKDQNEEQTRGTTAPQQSKPTGRNAYAANAYQHVAEANTPSNAMLEDADENSAPAITIKGEETRKIQALMQDLKTLESQGIEHFRVTRGENFLDSLIEAVQALK